MSAPPPTLDERDLRALLQQLRTLATTAVPEWTPPAAGDAGLMLQRIYARLLELVLQRLNRVPEKNLLAFLNLLGVSLLPPSPARAALAYGLTPGAPPTFVPRGAQAGTKASAQQPAVIFETENDLTVLPAQLTQAFTIDPTWDRYTDQTNVVGGQSADGFTPFVGTKPLPHVLHVGGGVLFDFNRAADVMLSLSFPSGGQPGTAVDVSYEHHARGVNKVILPHAIADGGGRTDVEFTITDKIDEETLKGVGLEQSPQGITDRWLRAVLATPMPDDLAARLVRLSAVQLSVAAHNLLPDFAFNNDAPLDVTKDFFPLGQTPKVGDTFFVASREALSKPGAHVTLNVKVREPPPPPLIFEFFDERTQRWEPFTKVQDGTTGFTRTGIIDCGPKVSLGRTDVNGVAAQWVRVRFEEGGYINPPRLKGFGIFFGADQRAPEFGFANRTLIDFKDFLPFGDRPGPADFFYFGENEGFSTGDKEFTFRAEAIVDTSSTATATAPVVLRWEYLTASGWQELTPHSSVAPGVEDKTLAFTKSGEVLINLPPPSPLPVALAASGEVNSKDDYWVRARIVDGSYGRAAEFVAVDPDDPKQGFRMRAGTGNIQPPQLTSLSIDYEAQAKPNVIAQNGFLFRDETNATEFAPFVPVPELTPDIYADREPTLYVGFDAAFPEEPVTLYAEVAPSAFAGSVVKETRAAPAPSALLPPLVWEYFNGTAWRPLVVFDRTNNFTASGSLEFLTPEDIGLLAKFDITARYWVRARSATNDPFDTQRLAGVFLNTVPALQATTARGEVVGSTSELPGQQLRLARAPVLRGQQLYVREPEAPSDVERATLEAEEGADALQTRVNPATGEPENWVRWHETDSFLESDARSRHYTLDRATGLITFGDGKRGLVPPRGTNNVAADYRSGGGVAGNVGPGAIAQIVTAVAGVKTVANPFASDGGAAAETVAMVEQRGPQTIRHRAHAVASGDLVWLAREAAGTRVARAKCLSNVNRELRFEPGWATLLIVPGGTESKLLPSSALIREVEDFLNARAFMGLSQQTPSRINVIGAGYLKIKVLAKIVPQDIGEAEQVKQRAVAALDAFLHPLTGGPRGTGWEFGRDVYESEVAQALESVAGVNHVETLRLVPNQAERRLTFTTAPMTVRSLPVESAVINSDLTKAARLAEPVPGGEQLTRVTFRGFKEGDRITRVLDVKVKKVAADAADSRRLTLDVVDLNDHPLPNDAVGFPTGSLVTTFDGARRLRLTQPVPRQRTGSDSKFPQIFVEQEEAAEGFKVGDVLTVFYPFPMTVTSVELPSLTLAVQSVSGGNITVSPFNSGVQTIPLGSVVTASDGARRTRLAFPIAPDKTGLTSISVADVSFASQLRPGDTLEVLTPTQLLGIEPYEAEVAFPVGSVLASLDNRVRLTLRTSFAAKQPVTSILLQDFLPNADVVSIVPRDGTDALTGLSISSVEPVTDIVHLDDNFLVYPGAHQITVVGDAEAGA